MMARTEGGPDIQTGSGSGSGSETGTGSDENIKPVDRIRQTASEAYETAKQRTSALVGSARDRANDALDSGRESAVRAGRKTAEGVDANPVAALIGGLAIGAAVAVLLPRTNREDAALGKIGSRITDGARQATEAAREAGREKLGELGLSREGARDKLNAFASGAGDALRRSASAAAGSVRKGDRD
jgi:ElaB/YqjD/DUF883 family membrane-anchored ribosome-binding protein